VRQCDFPAMRDNPLHLILFPTSCKETEEEEVNWTIEALRETLLTRPARFRKVCLEDGTTFGYAGWSLEQIILRRDTAKSGDKLEEPKRPNQCQKRGYWHPSTLDVEAWVEVSRLLWKEKIRVLHDRNNIWRKFDTMKFRVSILCHLLQVST
jgi:hypothetical protein